MLDLVSVQNLHAVLHWWKQFQAIERNLLPQIVDDYFNKLHGCLLCSQQSQKCTLSPGISRIMCALVVLEKIIKQGPYSAAKSLGLKSSNQCTVLTISSAKPFQNISQMQVYTMPNRSAPIILCNIEYLQSFIALHASTLILNSSLRSLWIEVAKCLVLIGAF